MNRTNRLTVDDNIHGRQRKKEMKINSKPEERKRTISNQSNKSSFDSKKHESFGDKIQDKNKKIWNKKSSQVNQNIKNTMNSFRPQRQKLLFQNNNKNHQDNKKKHEPSQNNKQNNQKQVQQPPKRKFIMKKSNFQNPPSSIQIKDDSSQEGSVHQIDKSDVNFEKFDDLDIPQNKQIKKSQKMSIKKQQSSKMKQSLKKYQQPPQIQKYSKSRNKFHRQQSREQKKKSERIRFEENPQIQNQNHNSKGRDLVMHIQKSKPHQKRQSHPIFNRSQQQNPASKRYKQEERKRLKQFQAIIQSKRDAFNKINQHLDINRQRYPVYIEFDMLADRVIRGAYRNYEAQVDRVNRQNYGSNIRKIQQVIRDIEDQS